MTQVSSAPSTHEALEALGLAGKTFALVIPYEDGECMVTTFVNGHWTRTCSGAMNPMDVMMNEARLYGGKFQEFEG